MTAATPGGCALERLYAGGCSRHGWRPPPEEAGRDEGGWLYLVRVWSCAFSSYRENTIFPYPNYRGADIGWVQRLTLTKITKINAYGVQMDRTNMFISTLMCI